MQTYKWFIIWNLSLLFLDNLTPIIQARYIFPKFQSGLKPYILQFYTSHIGFYENFLRPTSDIFVFDRPNVRL